MKTFWKALGIAALAAAVPVRIKKDETTGKKKYQSLLLSVDVGPGEGGEGTDIGINFGEGVITGAITNLVDARKEAELFADDDPEAAVLELQAIADEAQEAADEAQAIADEAQEAADEAQAIADEAQAIADEAAEAAAAHDGAGDDDDFVPEF